MRSTAKAASLTASLLKHEPSQTIRSSIPPSPLAAADRHAAQPATGAAAGALFFVKGGATAQQFQRTAPLDLAALGALAPPDAATAALPDEARALRLWLRVDPRLRRRMKRAAASRGQTGQAFLVDALDAFLAEPGSLARRQPAPRQSAARPRVKLSFRVDAARRGALQRLAAQFDCPMQALLHAALDAHLERVRRAPGQAVTSPSPAVPARERSATLLPFPGHTRRARPRLPVPRPCREGRRACR